jgi:hypothetical protein
MKFNQVFADSNPILSIVFDTITTKFALRLVKTYYLYSNKHTIHVESSILDSILYRLIPILIFIYNKKKITFHHIEKC